MREVTVVGAGVVGLTCASELVARGHRVRVVAAATGRATTSYAAGAMVSPAFGSTDPRMHRWTATTLEHMHHLAASDPAAGVAVRPTLLGSRMELPRPAEADDGAGPGLPDWPADDLPPGFVMGMRAELPYVAMPSHLSWLEQRLAAAGVAAEERHVDSLDEVDAPVVVNATGVGARELVGDTTVTADRGQHVVVRNPGVEHCLYEVSFEGRWASWMVHGDGAESVLVLGGASLGDVAAGQGTEPDHEVAAGILERCAALEPRIADAEVLEHRVGLRPSRPSVRLELDAEDGPDPRPGRRVVHCYGHGGMGVTTAYGCALDVVDLVALEA